ncbi:hypothetical protein N7493_001899 [Penicillium malachiteum]|uniref:Uncharacterized protein n=1 Tax=Penicillium malachiteum TaxID=1324776 RepID=A0AAD6HVM8_9EURO|nr:hypothetical protein N7493_001899 [Penicillium malachiteum]
MSFSDNERICKLFVVYDSDRNPFRSLIPLGLKDSVLLKSLLAFAARHHVNTGRSFQHANLPTEPGLINANRDALSFKHQAIEALSRSVQHDQLRKRSADSSRIKSTCESRDVFKFNNSEILIILIELKLLEQLSYAQNYCHSSAHLISKSCKTKKQLRSRSLGAQTIQCLSMQRDSFSSSGPLDSAAVASHITETESLMEFVQNFDCYAWASNLQRSRNSSAQEISNLCILSQSYKLGTLLYGRRILDALIEEESVQDELISQLLGLIDSLKDDPALFKCILWPVFVAGLECKWQAQRDFLIGCLERFWTLTNCLNAVNAAKFLLDHWQGKDSELSTKPKIRWIFDIGNVGRDWLWI